MHKDVLFSLPGAMRGAKRSIPLAISDFTIGIAFGVLTHQAKINLVESALMSGLVFAGAAQFVALSLWSIPLPVITILLTTLIVNLRHVLMGASLRPWFARLSPLKAYALLFFMVDESWALLIKDFDEGNCDCAFLLGSGLLLLIGWTGGTIVGQTMGMIIQDPKLWGLDFAFTAAFAALLTTMWKGKTDLLPWLTAGMVAVATSYLLPGKWYILLGGLAGSLVGAFSDAK